MAKTSLALEYAHRFMTSPAAALRHIRVWPKTGEDQAAELGHHASRRACDHRRQHRVAQFIYLLLHNEKIRDVIDTIGKRARSCWAASLKALEPTRDVAVQYLHQRDGPPLLEVELHGLPIDESDAAQHVADGGEPGDRRRIDVRPLAA